MDKKKNTKEHTKKKKIIKSGTNKVIGRNSSRAIEICLGIYIGAGANVSVGENRAVDNNEACGLIRCKRTSSGISDL